MRLFPLFLCGCLFAPEVYSKRLEELDDDDKDGWSSDAGDCDDKDPARFPQNPETCDGIDNDCDDAVDEDVPDGAGYTDADGDGYGDRELPLTGCDVPEAVDNADDCDDTNAEISPEAVERCDGTDQDCDGAVDEDASDATHAFVDADGDGFGDPDSPWIGCDPAGTVQNDDDCDDARGWVYPGAPERLDGVVNDCSALPPDEVSASDADVVLRGTDEFGGALGLLGDYTGDGNSDLPVARTGSVALIIGPLVSGDVGTPRLIVEGYRTGLVGGGDLDGDGVTDLALGVADGVAIVDGNARGSIHPAATLTGATDPVWWDGTTLGALGDSAVLTWPAPVSSSAAHKLGLAQPSSLALVDVDGDGAEELVVGSATRGAVWVLPSSAEDESEFDQHIVDAEPDSRFGTVVLAVGDVDADGRADLAIGAPGTDDSGENDGAAYIFTEAATGTEGAAGFIVGRSADARAGTSLVAPGDTDGDGRADLWVSGPGAAWDGTGPVATLALYRGPIVGRTEARSRFGFVLGDAGSALGAGVVSYPKGFGAAGDLVFGAPGHDEVYLFHAAAP